MGRMHVESGGNGFATLSCATLYSTSRCINNLVIVIKEPRVTTFLFPRLSIAVQQGNVVSFQNTVRNDEKFVVAAVIRSLSIFMRLSAGWALKRNKVN